MDNLNKAQAPRNYDECTTMAARERSAQVLRNRARHYHEHAVQLEKLADFAVRLNDEQDEALWNILQGFGPR